MSVVHQQRLHAGIPRPSMVLLRGRLPLVLAGVIAALAFGGAFGHRILLAWDEPVSWSLRGSEAQGFFRHVTDAGSFNLALMVSVVSALLLWKRCRTFAVLFPSAVLIGALVDFALKTIVGRPRPPMAAVGTALSSFPSGHVIQSVVLFGLLPPVLYILTRRKMVFWGSAVLLPTAVLGVAVSRVYLGAHWPSDVIGGILVGAVLLVAAEHFVAGRIGHSLCNGCALHKPAAPQSHV